MFEFFLFLCIKVAQVGLWMVFGSIKLTWKILKLEGRAIRTSFRKYPIGFFAFFFHFVGFFISLFLTDTGHGEIWLRLYTLGLCGSMDDYDKITMALFFWVMKVPEGHSAMDSIIMGLKGLWLMIPSMVLSLEMLFFLFPVLQSILTQLILGIPFRSFVQNWRQKRMENYIRRHGVPWDYEAEPEEVYVQQPTQQVVHQPVQQEAQLRSCQMSPVQSECNGLCSITFTSNDTRQPIREFNQSYANAMEKVSAKNFEILEAYKKLSAVKGKKSTVERCYEEFFEINNELQQLYMHVFDIVSFSEDEYEVKDAYDKLKRKIMMMKNVQIDFVNEMRKVYGIK